MYNVAGPYITVHSQLSRHFRSLCVNIQVKKGLVLTQNFADDLQIQTWPVFYDDLPFSKL